MDDTGLFGHHAHRHQIDDAAARLARRKRAVVSRGSHLGKTLYGKLASPGALIIAGGAGYLIGELSRPPAGADRAPVHSRPAGALFDDASLWLKSAVALISWTHAMLDAPAAPGPSGKRDAPHRTPPAA